MSAAEESLALQLRAAGIAFEREYRWEPTRRWRADFLVMDHQGLIGNDWLIEVEGGAFNGGHRRGAEADKDCERHNNAITAGFKVLRFTPRMVMDGMALATIRRAIGMEEAA